MLLLAYSSWVRECGLLPKHDDHWNAVATTDMLLNFQYLCLRLCAGGHQIIIIILIIIVIIIVDCVAYNVGGAGGGHSDTSELKCRWNRNVFSRDKDFYGISEIRSWTAVVSVSEAHDTVSVRTEQPAITSVDFLHYITPFVLVYIVHVVMLLLLSVCLSVCLLISLHNFLAVIGLLRVNNTVLAL